MEFNRGIFPGEISDKNTVIEHARRLFDTTFSHTPQIALSNEHYQCVIEACRAIRSWSQQKTPPLRSQEPNRSVASAVFAQE